MKNGNPILITVMCFIPSNQEARPIYFQMGNKEIGLLQEMKNTLRIDKPHLHEHQAKEREKILFSINRMLSKRFVYGY